MGAELNSHNFLSAVSFLVHPVDLCSQMAENLPMFFLEAEIVDNIFQWDVLKNIRQLKCYDDMLNCQSPYGPYVWVAKPHFREGQVEK